MSQNPAIERENLASLTTFWNELSDFGMHQVEAASTHCMRRICDLIGAGNAFWVGSVRICNDAEARTDLMHGWRVRGANYMDQFYFSAVSRPPKGSPVAAGGTLSFQLKSEIPDPGMTTIRITETAGHFRSFRLQAGLMVDLEAFSKTDHYKIAYSNLGVSDRIWVVFPVSKDAESVFVFDRFGEQGEFSDAEMELAASALSGIKWFHRQLLLSHGLGICKTALTPSEHRVKREILAGASEREIAQSLSLAPGSVHQYATRIYRKFGVQGRTEFMALWLSGVR